MKKLVSKYQLGGYTLLPKLTGLLGPLAPQGRGGLPSTSPRKAKWNGKPITECAQTSNNVMNAKKGYHMAGDAWTRRGRTIYNGYDAAKRPEKYSLSGWNQYSWSAADSAAQHIDLTKLDKNKYYDVNMYVTDSPNSKKAWEGNVNNRYGSHTGHMYWDGTQWKVFHNMHGDVYEDNATDIMGSKYNWGITGLFEPMP